MNLIRRLRALLPEGRLPAEMWAHRHRWIVRLIFAHAVGLTVFGVARGFSVRHSLLEGSAVALIACLASTPKTSRKLRSGLGALGLVTSSAILVHMSGGAIEAHFHFFFAISVLTLYQDWSTFLLAITYVVVHHGMFGVIDPTSVYNHPAAWANPWKWAAIHGMFVLAASVALIISWRVTEVERDRSEAYRRQLLEADRRRKQALEINDNIVQGLAVAQMALSLGRPEETKDALVETLSNARHIISELIGESDDDPALGSRDLVRLNPATVGRDDVRAERRSA